VRILTQFTAHPRHDFWTDSVCYERVSLAGVIGHRRVTDAYLASLARANEGRIATLDRGLAHLHADVADLVPR
jgi:predicted nucleic acid-binding protein